MLLQATNATSSFIRNNRATYSGWVAGGAVAGGVLATTTIAGLNFLLFYINGRQADNIEILSEITLAGIAGGLAGAAVGVTIATVQSIAANCLFGDK